MNPDNYGSREACQRLVDAGIVLETEAVWEDGDYGWFLRLKENDDTEFNQYLIPAPSMAEVWRELPNGITIRKLAGQMWVWIDTNEDSVQHNTNPTDALIDLRIWLEERKKGT